MSAATPRARTHLLVLAAAAASVAADGGRVTPGGAGARSHFAPAAGAGEDAMTDELQRRIYRAAVKAAGARGIAPPVADARLEAFADILARTMGPDEVPGVELQEFLLSHFGLGDPAPQLRMVQTGATDGAIRDRFTRDMDEVLARGSYARIGIGVHRRWFRKSIVVALQRSDVELLPVPRRLPADGTALIGGRLLSGLRDPRVLAARPAGHVDNLEVRRTGESFQTTFACTAAGRHQLEITGVGGRGKTVVANFPVYCGVEPPASFPRVAISRPETTDPRRAEALLLEAVNRDRAATGLSPLLADESLARVARRYSAELAAGGAVHHVSATSGNAANRVERGGVNAAAVLENVGRANSVADAQRSFMTSPGHRANVLHPRMTRFGAGITISAEGGAVPTLYVTQLFAP